MGTYWLIHPGRIHSHPLSRTKVSIQINKKQRMFLRGKNCFSIDQCRPPLIRQLSIPGDTHSHPLPKFRIPHPNTGPVYADGMPISHRETIKALLFIREVTPYYIIRNLRRGEGGASMSVPGLAGRGKLSPQVVQFICYVSQGTHGQRSHD